MGLMSDKGSDQLRRWRDIAPHERFDRDPKVMELARQVSTQWRTHVTGRTHHEETLHRCARGDRGEACAIAREVWVTRAYKMEPRYAPCAGSPSYPDGCCSLHTSCDKGKRPSAAMLQRTRNVLKRAGFKDLETLRHESNARSFYLRNAGKISLEIIRQALETNDAEGWLDLAPNRRAVGLAPLETSLDDPDQIWESLADLGVLPV